MKRAKWSFEQAGFTVIPGPTCFIDREPIRLNAFIPGAHALALSAEVLHEWLGCWWYRLVG